jgi:hypothetical protein
MGVSESKTPLWKLHCTPSSRFLLDDVRAAQQVPSDEAQLATAYTGLAQIRRADQAGKSAASAAKLAHEALALADLAYRAGATTNLEVIDAERRARDADTAAVIAEDNARQARLDLPPGNFRSVRGRDADATVAQ